MSQPSFGGHRTRWRARSWLVFYVMMAVLSWVFLIPAVVLGDNIGVHVSAACAWTILALSESEAQGHSNAR